MTSALSKSSSTIDLETATPSQLLHLAATLGRTDLVMSAINSGADVNAQIVDPAKTGMTQTALHAAVHNHHIDVTRALLSVASCDPHLHDSSGRTAISYLSNTSKKDASLLAVFASDLCQKAARDDVRALSRAIKAGLDPARIDSPHLANTPLHWAASFGANKCVRLLIDTNVPLNIVNKAGHTPLLDAAAGAHKSVVRMLLDAGAKISIDDNKHVKSYKDVKISEEIRTLLEKNQLSIKRKQTAIPSHNSSPTPGTTITATTTANQINIPSITSTDSNINSSYDDPIPPNPHTPSFLPGQSNTSSKSQDFPPWASTLWPRPRRFIDAGDSFTVPPVLTISAENSCLSVARLLIQWLSECEPLINAETTIRLVGGGQGGLGEPIAFSAAVFLRIDPHALESSTEAYSICVRDFGIDVIGSDPHGLFYACATLVNLFHLAMDRSEDPAAPITIPTVSISDWPCIRRRALFLDISRRRVPTVETLKRVIVFMARHLKMNQLHLGLTENFDRLKGISMQGMFRHEDILELDEYCKLHFVDLIPVISQSCARTHGINGNVISATNSNNPSSSSSSVSTTLNGGDVANNTSRTSATKLHSSNNNGGDTHTSNNTEDFEMLMDEFLPLFDTEQVNLGNVEDSKSTAIPDFVRLRSLLRSLRSRGKKTMMVFSSQFARVMSDVKLVPSIIPELPARMIMILEESTNHGEDNDETQSASNNLEKTSLLMRRHGLPFYTCASSCLQGTITGRLSSSLSQTERVVKAAISQGGAGVILKDSSMSHSNAPLIFLLQALIPFGGAAWNDTYIIHGMNKNNDSTLQEEEENEVDDLLKRLLDTYVFEDRANKALLGGIALSLGDLHVLAGDKHGNLLPKLLSQCDDNPMHFVDKLAYMGLRRAVKRADRMEVALTSYDGNADDALVAELRLAALFMGVAARMGAWLISISSALSMDNSGTVGNNNNNTSHVNGISSSSSTQPLLSMGRKQKDERKTRGTRTRAGNVSLLSLPDGRRSDLCNTLLQAVELLRETWMSGYHKQGFVEAVDEMVGKTLKKLAQDMPYQTYLEERRAQEWEPVDE